MGGSPADSEREDEELSQVSREDPIVSSSWGVGDGFHACEIEEVHSARLCSAYYGSTPSTRSSVVEDSNNFQTEIHFDNAIPLKDMISSLFGTNMDVDKVLHKNPELHRTIDLCASLPSLLSCARNLDTIVQCAVRPDAIYPQKLDTFREEGKRLRSLRTKLFVFNESLILQQRMMMANMQPGDRKFHNNKLRIRKDEVAAGAEREAYDAFNNLVVIRLLASRMLSKIQALLAAAESYDSGDNNWRVAITGEASGFTSCIEELEGQSLQWRESVQREVTVALEEIVGKASVNTE